MFPQQYQYFKIEKIVGAFAVGTIIGAKSVAYHVLEIVDERGHYINLEGLYSTRRAAIDVCKAQYKKQYAVRCKAYDLHNCFEVKEGE